MVFETGCVRTWRERKDKMGEREFGRRLEEKKKKKHKREKKKLFSSFN